LFERYFHFPLVMTPLTTFITCLLYLSRPQETARCRSVHAIVGVTEVSIVCILLRDISYIPSVMSPLITLITFLLDLSRPQETARCRSVLPTVNVPEVSIVYTFLVLFLTFFR
jgi:uncharacterized membrane protein